MLYFKAKMHQNPISAGAPPQTQLGAYSAPRGPLAGFKGPTSKGKRGEWIDAWSQKIFNRHAAWHRIPELV